MPKGPKGQKRPADVIGNAVRVMQIATGEAEEEYEADDGKDPAAKALGKKGGAARTSKLTPEQRKEIARKAAAIPVDATVLATVNGWFLAILPMLAVGCTWVWGAPVPADGRR